MKQLLEKIKSGQKEQILILILAGVLLLVIAVPTNETKTQVTEIQQEKQVSLQLSKREELEQKLQQVLQSVSGVGKAEVMISLKSDGQKIVEKDLQISERKEDSGESGADSSSEQRDSSESTVYQKDSNGTEIPYVTETIEPEITGVLVVAQGAGNAVTVNEITEAVMALFGVEAHKIKVMKMQ